MSVAQAADRLAHILDTVPARLAAIPEEDASRSAGPGHWSPKEIIGHLIDSASNNHQRFVRAQLAPEYSCPSYEQQGWVAAQYYKSEPWYDLLNLWVLYNRHLAHVIRHVSESALETPVSIRGNAPVTLSQLMIDYVGHLEHYLGQILSAPPA
jgi:hypothetical protein